MGDYNRALEAAQRAFALAETVGELRLQLLAGFYRGLVHVSLGDYRLARQLFNRCIGAVDVDLIRARVREYFPALLSRAVLNLCLAELGQFGEGMTIGEETVQLAETIANYSYGPIVANSTIGYLYVRKGEPDKAIRKLEHSLALSLASDILELRPWTVSLLGCAYMRSGRLFEGLPLLEQAVDSLTSMNVMTGRLFAIGSLSEAYLLAGRIADAREVAEQALDLCRALKERGSEAWTLRLLGEIATPDVDQAEAHLGQAMAVAEDLGMRPLVAHCYLGLGKLSRRAGQREQAHEHLTTATTMYREMGMMYWLEKAEAQMLQ